MNEDQTTHALAAALPLPVSAAPAARSCSPAISRHFSPPHSGALGRVATTTGLFPSGHSPRAAATRSRTSCSSRS
jgi:hypothetical protein